MPILQRMLFLFALTASPALHAAALQTATFAGGCFWCVEEAFDKVDGVQKTISGYANGNTPDPTYEQVSAGGTGYVESVQVTFDPQQVSYAQLLDVFWHNHDPTDKGGQFCDRGKQYRPVVFYHSTAQLTAIQGSVGALRKTKPFAAPIVTAIEPLKVFYPAEEYHQNYHAKNPVRYGFYKYSCGRAARLEALWGE